MDAMETTPHGVDKVSRYGWVMKNEPGEQKALHKSVLMVNQEYQREVLLTKVRDISSAWSWISFGAIVVAERDGEFWVIDGQHRVMAAKRRSDISTLPCVVFKTFDVKEEAQGFLDLNTGRKPVTATAKHKAMVAAGDEVAIYVQQQLEALGLEVKSTANTSGQIKCVAWCLKRAAENRDAFHQVISLATDLSNKDNMHVSERVLDGLWILNQRCGDGLLDKRLTKRLREKGARLLLDAANRAAAYYASGGAKIWAQGMLAELNKGLQKKFVMDGVEA